MRSTILPLVLVTTMAGCGGKKDEPPKTAAPPTAQDAAVPTPPPAPPIDAAPVARVTTRSGPWSIDVKQVTTTDALASAGFKITPEWDDSREPMLQGIGVDLDDADDVSVVAFVGREGEVAGEIIWLQTLASHNAEIEQGAPFAKAGLCVEGVCPGAPTSAAVPLGMKDCEIHRIEMEFRYYCPVAGSQLAVIVDGGDELGKVGRKIAFSKLVKAKLAITALAWEPDPNLWAPMSGCTTDCD